MIDGPSWVEPELRAVYHAVRLSWEHDSPLRGWHVTGHLWNITDELRGLLKVGRDQVTDDDTFQKLERLVECGALRVTRDHRHGHCYRIVGSLLEAIAWASR